MPVRYIDCFYLGDGKFLFIWKDALFIAIKKGVVAGSILAMGLWFKGWLYERKKEGINEKNTKP